MQKKYKYLKNNISLKLSFFFFSLSIFLLVLLTKSIIELFLPFIFLFFSILILYIFGCRNKKFFYFFFNIYSVGLFWISISSFYRIYFNDYIQTTLDPNNFYNFSTIPFDNISFIDVVSSTEGALAIYIWRPFYVFFSYFGFDKPILIGLLVNNVLVCFSGVIGLSICKLIYQREEYVSNKFSLIFPFCAIFWQFQSIHYRDSFVLFFIT